MNSLDLARMRMPGTNGQVTVCMLLARVLLAMNPTVDMSPSEVHPSAPDTVILHAALLHAHPGII